MTSYEAAKYFGSTSTLTASMAILAGSQQMRIVKIEAALGGQASVPISLFRYSGAGLSGGTALTPGPLRDGASPALATVKTNPTISGTSTLLNTQLIAANATFLYQFAFDVLIAPGSAFYVLNTVTTVAAGANLFSLAVQFEELPLARSV